MNKREFVLRKANQSRDVAHEKQAQHQKTSKIAPQKKKSSRSDTTQNSLEGYDYRKIRGNRNYAKCSCGAVAMPQSDYCFYCNPK